MDVARTAIRNGVRKVTVMYRGGSESITAEKAEIEMAKVDGVSFELYKAPVEITDDGVLYVNTGKDSENADVGDAQHLFRCNSVIVSISQGPRDFIVSSTEGIEIGKNGLVKTDLSGKTTRSGVFASGDVVTGAKTVVQAVKVSKQVADEIDRYVHNG